MALRLLSPCSKLSSILLLTLLPQFPATKAYAKASIRSQRSPPIEFISHPQSQTACPGDQLLFRCDASGTESLPAIFINEVSYSVTSLPLRYYYSHDGLVLSRVRQQDHGTRIRCALFYWDEGQFQTIYSQEATISVPTINFDSVRPDSHCQPPSPDQPVTTIPDDLVNTLENTPNVVHNIDLDLGCVHITKAILLDRKTGFTALPATGSDNMLVLIDGSLPLTAESSITVSNSQALMLVGLPLTQPESSDSSGSATSPEQPAMAEIVFDLPAEQPGIDCDQGHCYLKNLKFTPSDSYRGGGELIRQRSGRVSLHNVAFGSESSPISDTLLIKQQGGSLTISESDFFIGSGEAALDTDRNSKLCDTRFYCLDQCESAIAYNLYTPECQPVALLHSEFEGFDCPVRVMPVQADHNFVIPVNFTGNQMTGKSLTGSNITAVTLNGPLKLHYHDNRLVNVNTGLLFEPDNRVDVISSGGNYIAADISYSGCPAKGTLRFFRPDREEESVIAECGPRSSESPPHTTGSASGYSMTGILPLLMMSWISIELGRGTVSH